MRAKDDRAQRHQRFRSVWRVSGHPLECLEVGLQPAAFRIACNPLHAYASQLLAGGHDGLGQLVGRQIDDEVVDNAPLSLLLHDLDGIDVGANPAHGSRDRAQRSRPVREGDPHQEHGNIFPYVDYWDVSGHIKRERRVRTSERKSVLWRAMFNRSLALVAERAVDPPTSPSVGGDRRVSSVLLSTTARDPWKGCAVPRFEPFAAIRYATDDLASVIAPPYDVLSDADIDVLEARSALNVVRIDVPRGGEDRYERAAKIMRGWLNDGILAVDSEPSFTIYRMRFTDSAGVPRDIAGVLGGLEVVDQEAGGVLPHERTTAAASTDRLDLTRATQANLSPVWGLSLSKGLTDLLVEPGKPWGTVMDDGVEHVLELVTDPQRIAAIRDRLTADDVLIADGHHRYESLAPTVTKSARQPAGPILRRS